MFKFGVMECWGPETHYSITPTLHFPYVFFDRGPNGSG
jgi:hypothetical protein